MSFETLLNMIKKVREQEVEELTLCPDCDYPLSKKTDGTLHCLYCGYSWPRRISNARNR